MFVNNGLLVKSTPAPFLFIYVYTSASLRRVETEDFAKEGSQNEYKPNTA